MVFGGGCVVCSPEALPSHEREEGVKLCEGQVSTLYRYYISMSGGRGSSAAYLGTYNVSGPPLGDH